MSTNHRVVFKQWAKQGDTSVYYDLANESSAEDLFSTILKLAPKQGTSFVVRRYDTEGNLADQFESYVRYRNEKEDGH